MRQKKLLMVVLVAVLFVGLMISLLPSGKAHAAPGYKAKSGQLLCCPE